MYSQSRSVPASVRAIRSPSASSTQITKTQEGVALPHSCPSCIRSIAEGRSGLSADSLQPAQSVCPACRDPPAQAATPKGAAVKLPRASDVGKVVGRRPRASRYLRYTCLKSLAQAAQLTGFSCSWSTGSTPLSAQPENIAEMSNLGTCKRWLSPHGDITRFPYPALNCPLLTVRPCLCLPISPGCHTRAHNLKEAAHEKTRFASEWHQKESVETHRRAADGKQPRHKSRKGEVETLVM